MFRYHVKSLFRDLSRALHGRGPWFEVRYHALSAWSDLIHPFRAFWYGCVNLYHYLPIIWHDRDWDYSCMLDLWEKKFQRMAYLQERWGHHVGHLETARQLRVCAQLCARIRDDNYADHDHEQHDIKWGKARHRFERTGHGTSRMLTDRDNVRTPGDEKLETWEFLHFMRAADAHRVEDLKYLCLLITKHCLTWWD